METVLSRATKLFRSSQRTTRPLSLNYCMALIALCDLVGIENVEQPMVGSLVVHGRHVLLVAYGSKFRDAYMEDDHVSQLDIHDVVVFARTQFKSKSVELTWIDAKKAKATAEYYGCGSYHGQRKKAFSSQRWVIEQEHLCDMSSFLDG